ncbi:ComEC/Rec2 family competence protein [Urbifossiella limnaea]|uniref:Uncharacterized protein n=1 Tax=Urbifossiella limnaea TaxID=2528023 RepID=A0A517Y0K3_9BACT|nr:hypothetical protein [Urbifossiella limnaea]QDU23285.1 hypothetical protein ETAA1_52790 [Urbifossiella limnaea]
MAKATAAADDKRLLPKPGEAVVRMYRAGLGDCFLLAFGRLGQEPVYVLVDCGIHARQDKGPARLLRVMRDLRAATGGHLDVVVATHEHADHLSGFVQKGSPFVAKAKGDTITFDQLWVAWTEKQDKGLADKLRARRGAYRAAIKSAVKKLEDRGLGADGKKLEGLGDFEKMDPKMVADEFLGAAAGAPKRKGKDKAKPTSNEVALAMLQKHADKTKYWEPEEVAPVPGVPWARAYVLGPPTDEARLKKDLPTGGDEGENRETYLTGRGELTALRLAPALDLATSLGSDFRYPFEKSARRRCPEVTPKKVSADDVTDAPATAVEFWQDRYLADDEAWRRIDDDWLGAADQLGLDLEADTNNTSLVLAFEVGEPGLGKVLLFVGDAQVGNWLSWHGQEFKVGGTTTTADDLLRRTALYKVGHHGSHNATAKRVSADDASPFGLELMPPGLIAMIPVDRAAAQREMPQPWKMPHQPLYQRLLQKAAGRVLRSDGGGPWWKNAPEQRQPTGAAPAAVPGVTGARWRESAEAFPAAEGRQCPIYYEVVFSGVGS